MCANGGEFLFLHIFWHIDLYWLGISPLLSESEKGISYFCNKQKKKKKGSQTCVVSDPNSNKQANNSVNLKNNIFSMQSLETGWFVSKIKWKSFVKIRIKETTFIEKSFFLSHCYFSSKLYLWYKKKKKKKKNEKKLLSWQFYSVHNAHSIVVNYYSLRFYYFTHSWNYCFSVLCIFLLSSQHIFLIFKMCNNRKVVIIGYNGTSILNLE